MKVKNYCLKSLDADMGRRFKIKARNSLSINDKTRISRERMIMYFTKYLCSCINHVVHICPIKEP